MKQIVIIGIDGAGKSTQAAMLSEAINGAAWSKNRALVCKSAGLNYKVFDGITDHGFECIPDSIRAAGYSLDMCNKYLELIEKYKGEIPIWDRYSYCIEAYFETLGVDMNDMKRLFSFFAEPSITFLLDLDAELAMQRLKQRGGKVKPGENLEFLKKVREKYLELADERNFIIVDASQDNEKVHGFIMEAFIKEMRL